MFGIHFKDYFNGLLAYGINGIPTGPGLVDLAFTDTTADQSSVAAQASRDLSGTVATGNTSGLGKTWGVVATDNAATNSPQYDGGTIDVYDHATGAISAIAHDFGSVDLGSTQMWGFNISNLLAGALTNGLDLTSITHTSGDGVLTTDVGTFLNLAAGSNNPFTATFDTSTAGTFEDVWTFHVQDAAGVDGASMGSDVVLTLSGIVVPEPSTLALLAIGLLGLIAYAWRKRK